MMVKLKAASFLVLIVLFASFSLKREVDMKPARILHQMFDSIKNVKTLRVKISALERVEKKFFSATSEVKLQTAPRKLYFVNKTKKLEILYNDEHTPGRALVKQHAFPYISVMLDPTGNMMRKNQHYTINELGFDFIGKSIALTIAKDRDGLSNFVYHGKVQKNGYSCYFLEYENKGYTYTDYTVGNKETATGIAHKLCVNDYLLRHKNDLLNDFGYLKRGSVLKVPTLFCKKAALYIDERLMLPVSINLYDDTGLFEGYDFSGIVVNRSFLHNEFSKEFKDYGF